MQCFLSLFSGVRAVVSMRLPFFLVYHSPPCHPPHSSPHPSPVTFLICSPPPAPILQLAVAQEQLDAPEQLWKQYIDFELERGELRYRIHIHLVADGWSNLTAHQNSRVSQSSLLSTRETKNHKIRMSMTDVSLHISRDDLRKHILVSPSDHIPSATHSLNLTTSLATTPFLPLRVSLCRSRVRRLYDRLLERSKHVKVWISRAQFEAGVDAEAARATFVAADAHFRQALSASASALSSSSSSSSSALAVAGSAASPVHAHQALAEERVMLLGTLLSARMRG